MATVPAPTFQLSQQQQSVIAWATDGEGSLNLVARAGCGKTFTLLELCPHLTGYVVLMAYNKSISTELQQKLEKRGLRFPNYQAATVHSLGFGACRKAWPKVKVDDKKVPKIAEEHLPPIDYKIYGAFISKAVSMAKQRAFGYLESASDESAWYDLVQHFGLEYLLPEPEDGDSERTDRYIAQGIQYAIEIYELSQQMDSEVLDFDDMVLAPLTHNLRMWPKDWVLIDEAQDTNPARRALALKMLRRHTGRLIAVGDPCQPAGTLVSTECGEVEIQEVYSGYNRLVGYQPSDAAFYKNRMIQGVTERQFTGKLIVVDTGYSSSRYTPGHWCYVDFSMYRDYYVTYLARRGNQYRVGCCKLNYKESGNGIVHRLRTEGGDAAWILGFHKEKREARLHELRIVYTWQIPQLRFKAANNAYILDAEGLSAFWTEIGNNHADAYKCLQAHRLNDQYPLVKSARQYKQSFKRPMLVQAANLIAGVKVLTYHGTAHHKEWVCAINVHQEHYSGPVYSLHVSHSKLYVADGIVTHNCQAIYGFTGADSDAMNLIKQELGSHELPLNLTYRCPKNVVALAQRWVPDITAHETAPDGIVGAVTYAKPSTDPDAPKPALSSFWEEELKPSDAILCRNNAPLLDCTYGLLRAGIACRVEGRDIAAGLERLARRWKISTLNALENRLTMYLERETQKWQAKGKEERAAIIEDQVATLRVIMERVRENGGRKIDDLVDELNNLFGDTKPGDVPTCVTLSSVHKAKGREWDRVFILGRDKYMPSKWAKKAWQREQERNLMYVAVTRAKAELIDIIV